MEHQQALDRERTRIARDLHDDLGATVTQVGLMLEELRSTPASPGDIKQQSAAISGRVLNLARDLDAVVWSVNPGNDSLGELFAYLGQTFLECFRHTGIRPRLEVMEQVPDVVLDARSPASSFFGGPGGHQQCHQTFAGRRGHLEL